MREILDKKEIKDWVKFVNREFFHRKGYEHYFMGTPLAVPDRLFFTKNEAYMVTLDNCDTIPFISYLKINEGCDSDIFEVLQLYKDLATTTGIHFTVEKGNSNMESFMNSVKKKYKDNYIEYRIGDIFNLIVYPHKAYRNILSIDIDVLFKDMLKIQECFNVDLPPKASWKQADILLKKKYNIRVGDIIPDRDTMTYIMQLLANNCKGAEVIHIWEHDEIVKIMREKKIRKANMYNIDYHEDVSYCNKDTELDIENWVLFAKKEDLINDYNFICQEDSKHTHGVPVHVKMSCWKDCPVEKLPKYDLVVICVSKHFTPPKWWYLAENLVNFVNNINSNKGE